MFPMLPLSLRNAAWWTAPRAPSGHAGSAPDAQGAADPAAALSGRWYEIARSPATQERDRFAATLDYRVHRDGGLSLTHRCQRGALNGMVEERRGRAPGAPDGAYRVAYDDALPFLRQAHHLLALDEDLALVGDPARGTFWLLSRAPHPAGTALDFAAEALTAQGLDPSLERAVQP